MLSRVPVKARLITSLIGSNSGRVSASSLTLKQPIDEFEVVNEPVLEYTRGSDEMKELEAALKRMQNEVTEVPLIIDGQETSSKFARHQVYPFEHSKKLAKYYWASREQIQDSISSSLKRREDWEQVPTNEKIKIILRAADLVSGKYRQELNAATMLGQSKTVVQAEIDASAELADFFRFNAFFLKELCKYQPISEDASKIKNTFRYRGIEGFFAAIAPFNFTAIGGNLATAPILVGNVVLWKPSDTAILSNYLIYKLLVEAGLPPGVINFVPSDGPVFGDAITSSPNLAGINFTGSVGTFRHLWKQTAERLDNYASYPRLIGECGGKNFHFVHPSAEVETVVPATIRGSFEFGGQKCSATSRAYVPRSLWPKIKEGLLSIVSQLKLGSPLEYDTFFSAVIDEKAFKRISGYVQYARDSSSCTVLTDAKCDDSVGYYIDPVIVETTDPKNRLMTEEIFGPFLTIYVYPDDKVDETLELAQASVGFALTGAIFGQDDAFLKKATHKLKMAAGNFYVNDKSTGSIVGQQPFGGGRVSGTNDKAGGPHYLLRFASPQNVKETFVPLTEWKYKYMDN